MRLLLVNRRRSICGYAFRNEFEPRQQPSCRESADHADRDDVLIATAFKAVERFAQPSERLDDAGQQQLPFVRERDATGQTAKQLYAEPIFQAFHVLTDGGLCDAKFQAGARKAEVPRRRLKRPQVH